MSENDRAHVLPDTVDGIELDGNVVTVVRDIPIAPPRGQENHSVPVMLHSGIPLYARKVPRRTMKDSHFDICRVMSDPDLGLSQGLWQDFNSLLQRTNPEPTLLFRADGVPFTLVDYNLVDDFEMEMLDGGPRQVTPHDWISFAMSRESKKTILEFQPPMCYLLDTRYTNPSRYAPLISDDSVRTLFLGGDTTHLRTPEGYANGSMAHGVRVHGEKLAHEEVFMRGASTPVSITKMAGLPIRARILRTSLPESRTLFRMTRLMKHPLTGKLPKSWEQPKPKGQASRKAGLSESRGPSMLEGFWPTHVFRSDGIPFTVFDFFVIDQFCSWVLPHKPGNIYENLWKDWINGYIRRHDEENVSIARSVLLTEGKFPAGTRVIVHGLISRTDLNGRVGFAASEASRKVGRIAVSFSDLSDRFAVKVDNVKLFNE